MNSRLQLAHRCVALGLLSPALSAQFSVGAAPSPPEPISTAIVFVDGTDDAGIDAFTFSNTDHSGGVAWIDYNGDYWPDLFMTNGLAWDHWLYRNNGDGTFSDVSTLVSKPSLALESCASLFGDIDNDGDSDLLVVVDFPIPSIFALGGPNLLYINNGDGTFSEQGALHGVLDPLGRRNTSGALADFDRDGSLDIFFGVRISLLFPLAHFDWYAHNDGSGFFSDATAGTGLDGLGRNALTAMPLDLDLDGWMDLYVGNAGPVEDGYAQSDSFDHFWINDGAVATFSDLVGTGMTIGNDASAAMGADIGDIDNDGDWDLYVTDNPLEGDRPLGNVLYMGDGAGGLQDNTCDISGICVEAATWPCNFADFDRDGSLDLWVGTLKSSIPDLVYHNNGDGTFTATSQPAMVNNNTRGGSIADFDGDGDVDIAFWDAGQDSPLYRNETPDGLHWLQIKLLGTTSNRDAIGALARATAGGTTQMRRVSGGDSAHSQQELMLHFGLGGSTSVDLQIDWPSGTTQTFLGVAADEVLFVDETDGILNESLTFVDAIWSSSTLNLSIEVKSNFGGRTDFDVSGLGSLVWSPESLSFTQDFPQIAANPGTVTLISRRGDSLPVTIVTVP